MSIAPVGGTPARIHGDAGGIAGMALFMAFLAAVALIVIAAVTASDFRNRADLALTPSAAPAALGAVVPEFSPADGRWGLWPETVKPALAIGEKGDAVKYLQGVLRIKAGQPGVPLDGKFGGETERAVERVQAFAGIQATGLVDEATWRVIDGLARQQ
jgi:murein L,D-transpeptidase YcbB/YkuD